MRKKKKSLVHIIAAILIILLLATILSDNNRLHQTTPTPAEETKPTTETLPEYKTARLDGELKTTGYTWTAKLGACNFTPKGYTVYMTIEPGTVDVDKTDEPPPLIFAYDTTGDGIINETRFRRAPPGCPLRENMTPKNLQTIFRILLKSAPNKEVQNMYKYEDPNILMDEPAEETLPDSSWWNPTTE